MFYEILRASNQTNTILFVYRFMPVHVCSIISDLEYQILIVHQTILFDCTVEPVYCGHLGTNKKCPDY